MNNEKMKIEQRLENLKKFYMNISRFIDEVPDVIPESVKTMLQEKILGDKDLKNLIDGIDTHRPPRFFLIGRTGVGKSSLINALCGSYVATVSNIKSCTANTSIYECKSNDRVLMEILDTRGIAESESLNDKISAEDMLIEQINEFSPDVTIFMLNCTHRDDVDSDIKFLKKVKDEYELVNKVRLPIVVVVNKSDEMAPARIKEPDKYTVNKINNISEVVRHYKNIIIKNNLQIDEIIPVSSLIDWQTDDGTEIDVENITSLPKNDIEKLQIAFDGRYKINELLKILDNAIVDYRAQMGLRMAARLDEVVMRMANTVNNTFAGIAASIAVTPIPFSDVYILIILQSTLVALIASLSGRDISIETAKEFIFGLGGIACAGYAFRLVAQQATKLLNGLFPGGGSAASSAIAYSGTISIGNAAIAYYLEETTMDEVKKQFDKEKQEKNM